MVRQTVLGLALLALAGLTACDSYLFHIARGQNDLLERARPIETVILDPTTEPETAEKLALVREAVAFAEHWGLDVGDSYQSYSQLDRDATVWTVYRAEKLEMNAVVNCWPIAGCVPYQGYFEEAKAEEFLKEAQDRGYDAYMGGVDAYATLGWFPDPIASPALDRSKTSLVELVIHESVHNTIYRPGAAEFNEALANTIAFALVKEFWSAKGVDTGQLEVFFAERDHARALFYRMINDTKAELEEIYAAKELVPSLRLRAKADAFARLKARYRAERHAFGGYNYDGFFARDLNNAHVVSIGTYENARPELEAVLYGRFGGNVRRFLLAMDEVAKSSEDWRDALAKARP